MIYVVCAMAGCFVGVVLMCLMAMAGKTSRSQEGE